MHRPACCIPNKVSVSVCPILNYSEGLTKTTRNEEEEGKRNLTKVTEEIENCTSTPWQTKYSWSTTFPCSNITSPGRKNSSWSLITWKIEGKELLNFNLQCEGKETRPQENFHFVTKNILILNDGMQLIQHKYHWSYSFTREVHTSNFCWHTKVQPRK